MGTSKEEALERLLEAALPAVVLESVLNLMDIRVITNVCWYV